MKNTSRLFIGIFLATYIPIIAFTATVFYISRQSLITFIGERLTGVNEMKAADINSFYDNLKPLTVPLPTVAGVRDALVDLAAKTSDANARTNAAKRVDNAIRQDYVQPELEEVIFVKTDKTVAYAYAPTASTIVNKPLAEYLVPVFDAGQRDNSISDLFKNPSGHLSLSISQPVHDQENYPLGVVIFHYNFQDLIDSVASSTGLSETGETFIVKKEDAATALHLSPLKTEPEATLNRRTVLSEESASPLRLAFAGERGFALGVDYRQVPVISAWDPLNIPSWAIVTKIDQSEGLSTFRNVRGMIVILIVSLAALLGIGLAWAIRQTVRRPLQLLEHSAEMIEKEKYDQADVDRSLIYSPDEFGSIATSLHHIVEHHRHHDHGEKKQG